MLRTLEQIRRMRGGAQSHLMRCEDSKYYVVKFQNIGQHRRVLVNQLLGTRLAARLGLPKVPAAIVGGIDPTDPGLGHGIAARIPCQPGLQFGSRYPGEVKKLVTPRSASQAKLPGSSQR